MQIHGLRRELQPEAVLKKERATAEANAKADRPVRGHDDVVPPLKKSAVLQSKRLLDIKG